MRQQQVRKQARRRTVEPPPEEQAPTPGATRRGEDRTSTVLTAIDHLLAQQP